MKREILVQITLIAVALLLLLVVLQFGQPRYITQYPEGIENGSVSETTGSGSRKRRGGGDSPAPGETAYGVGGGASAAETMYGASNSSMAPVRTVATVSSGPGAPNTGIETNVGAVASAETAYGSATNNGNTPRSSRRNRNNR